MNKKNKRFFSNSSLLFIFSANVFFIIMFVITNISVLAYAAYRLELFPQETGLVTDSIPSNMVIGGIIVLLLVSIIVGTSIIMNANATMLKPIRKMLSALKELSGGNFDVRVNLEGRYFPREIRDFSESFNATAQELSGVEMLRKDFINNFSHEFKTPIVSIGGFANLILEENLSKEEQEEYLRIIASESERLAALATNVLNLTKIETQTIVAEKSVFNVSEQIRRAVLMMDSKCSEKELSIDFEVNEIEYFGNAELLNQVWVNLIDNAIKFSPSGAELTIKLSDSDDSIVFKVKDSGSGMDEETQVHIFDKFYQGDPSRTTQGNGLGMTIVLRIVSLHEGQIKVESYLNEGTTITVLLPKTKYQK